MKKKVEFDWVCRADGTSEFEDYLDGIPRKDAAKLLAVIHNTEAEGIAVAIKMRWVKKLESGLYELRSKQGSDIQRAIYFHKSGTRYVITHGFTKKTQRTPPREIEHALEMRRFYEKGKQNEQN
jgi:phage-related protein